MTANRIDGEQAATEPSGALSIGDLGEAKRAVAQAVDTHGSRVDQPHDGADRGDTHSVGDMISRWTAHLAGQHDVEVGQRLPPHSPDCAGCGPDNPTGLHLHVVRTATGVEAVHSFSDSHVGAPGIAHGGAVALAFDDLFGFALYTVGSLAVTRSLTTEFLAPFRLHRPYTFRAQVAERQGRRLLLHADAWDDAGRKAGSASATFVVVGPQHFVANAEPDPARAITDS